MAAISNGIVMNGPIPTIFVMFSAVAPSRPKPRVRWGGEVVEAVSMGIGGGA